MMGIIGQDSVDRATLDRAYRIWHALNPQPSGQQMMDQGRMVSWLIRELTELTEERYLLEHI